MLKILHTADWQVGRVFSQFEPDDAAALFEARFRVVEHLAAIASEQSVDAVLVAGDVFDAQTVTDKTTRGLFNAMSAFAGDWHGTRRIDDRTWYAGTPETDRFKANDSGQALLVTIPGPGAMPEVTSVVTGQYRWQLIAKHLAVASDVEEGMRSLEGLGTSDVAQVSISGTCDLGGHRRLLAEVEGARARARALVWDDEHLRLEPTEDDIRSLRADGYVGEVLQELRAEQANADGEVSRDALLALARILDAAAQRTGGGV